MDKRQLQPATFSESAAEVNEQVISDQVIQKAAPVDPDSGSGSGSGGETFGNGHGVISSNHGGSWLVSCSFRWYASFKYRLDPEFDTSFITEITVRLFVAQASGTGQPTGSKVNGYYYEPLSFEVDLSPCEPFGSTAEVPYGFTVFDVELPVKQQEVKVLQSLYVNGRPTNPQIFNETLNIKLNLIFTSRNGTESTLPELSFTTCEIR